jgi:hypothetical protein
LEHHLGSSFTLLESLITLLELSIILLENIKSTGVTDGDHDMMIISNVFIIKAIGFAVLTSPSEGVC